MESGFKTKWIAAPMLAVTGLSSSIAMADGRFIVQPPRRSAVSLPPVLSEQPPRKETEKLSTPRPPAESVQIEAAAELDLRASWPEEVLPAVESAVNVRTVAEDNLRWMAREASPPAREVVSVLQPLEFENPGYFLASPSVAATSQPTSQPSVAVPVQETPKPVAASLTSSQMPANSSLARGDTHGERSVEAIDTPPGWQAIGQELSQKIANCEALINRKAYFSAREEAEAAMLHLVRMIDLYSNQYESEPAWHAARRAMLEAEDFSTAQRLTSDSDFLRRVVLSHETPVLKDAAVAALAPMAAAQHYRLYAEQKLVESSQGHPWASDVIYALGRTYQAQADTTQDGSEHALRSRAITLYRSARSIVPTNGIAANQLGYVLLQMDRPADAREVLLSSLNTSTSTAALENLIEASRRLGDDATREWALQRYANKGDKVSSLPEIPPVVEVDPRTFAAISPYTIGPNPINTGAQPVHVGSVPTNMMSR